MHETIFKHDAKGGQDTLRRSPHDRADAGPISIMPQTFEPFLAEALDAVPADCLPRLRLSGTLDVLRDGLDRGLRACGFGPDWLKVWLVENALFQARLFGELTRARKLALRLEAVDSDSCSRFHHDNVRYRLVTTYRGPGTEWIDLKAVAALPPGSPMPDAAIKKLERGWVAFLRGAKEATPERPALLHRSPPIAGTGMTRLFLAVDEADALV